ncbi:MAG: hypothetical protein DME45_00380 [Verrucomicrobia bacterium]|nr:MAG: hypothetical protein DME45_00380 [Verrucomicrobiota bacterium]
MKNSRLRSGLFPAGGSMVVSLLLIAAGSSAGTNGFLKNVSTGLAVLGGQNAAGLYDRALAVMASDCGWKAEPANSGLTTADWNSIRAAREAQRHAMIVSARGYRAPNPGQKWETEFDGGGFLTQPEQGDWRWGLELRTYGFPGHEQTATKAHATKAEGRRLTYERGTDLSEWFVNDRSGLEHGFTVAKRPNGPERNKAPLQFAFSVLGNLRPVIASDGSEVRFVNESGVAIVTYNKLEVLDADGRSLPAHFVAGTEGLIVSVAESTARYPITVDPIAQQAYVKASNTDAGDLFGSSIAIFGDTVVVGAPNENSAATGINGNQSNNSAVNAGAAYVFVRNGSSWSQQAYLKASNTGAGDLFGISVAISGDTVVVGAQLEASAATGINGNQSDNSAPDAGAAYVFVRNGATWTQQAYLKASNTDANDVFGRSVAISGNTIVVGASGEASAATGVNGVQSDNSAPGAGAAYVFVRDGNTWTQQAYLKASQAGPAAFGFDVAISGDTAVVGEEESSGAAYVFVRSGTTWTQQALLTASNAEAGDFFGMAVAISGNTSVVGAQHEASAATGINGNQSDNSATDAGAAYVFVRNGTTWMQQAYLKGSNTEAFDRFGVRVAISGDTAVVGAIGEDSSATGVNGDESDNTSSFAGAAYVFFRSGSTWTEQAYLKASNTGAFDEFGYSVAISGDTVAIGAWDEGSAATGINGDQSDNSAGTAGAAYIFAGLPATAAIQNISARAQVLTGGNVLIGGFIIGPTGNKDVLVRGLGPTLGDLGITGFLPDPTLDLRNGNQTQIAINDNWKDTQQAAIQATGKAPPHDSEPAILQTGLASGNYTAILAGKNSTTGVGLLEIYDQSPASTAQLTNISSRGMVGTNTNVMIAGFITAVAENRVIVRALGPTLIQFGVTGVLTDPVLGLFDANGNAVAANDNWQQSSQVSEIQNSGFAPPSAAESAIISIRPLGNTTAVVSGKNGTTGVALVEVYKLP